MTNDQYVMVYEYFRKQEPMHVWRWVSEDVTGSDPPPDLKCEHCGVMWKDRPMYEIPYLDEIKANMAKERP